MPHSTVRVQQNRLRLRLGSNASASPPPLTPVSSSTALSAMANGSISEKSEAGGAAPDARGASDSVATYNPEDSPSPTHGKVRFSIASDDLHP